jgi:hypothetical protein
VPRSDICGAANCSLFDHLVGDGEQRRWNFEAEYFGGGEVNDEIELGRLLDRQVARLRPAQNLVDEVGSAPPQDREVRSIGQETSVDVLPQTLALSVVARPAPKY